MSQEELIKQCTQIEEWFREVNDRFGTHFPADKVGRREVTEYISLLLSCDAFEPVWLEGNHYAEAGTDYLNAVQKLQLLKEAQKNLCELLLPETEPKDAAATSEKINDDAEEMLKIFSDFQEQYQQTLAKGVRPEELETESSRKKTRESLRQESEILKYTIEFVEDGCRLLERRAQQNDSDLIMIEELIELLCSNIVVPQNWITESRYTALVRFGTHQKQLSEKAKKLKNSLSKSWDSGIYRLDALGLSERFNRDYSSMLRRLGKQYRTDRELIENLWIREDENLLDSQILEMLDDLQQYQVCMNEFRKNDAEAAKLFGPFYQGLSTDWKRLERMLAAGERFHNFYMNYGMPETILHLCCKAPEERRQFKIREMSAGYMKDNQITSSLRKVTAIYRGRNFVRSYKTIRTQWKAMESFLDAMEAMENRMLSDISEITEISCKFEERPTVEFMQEYVRRYTTACDTAVSYRMFEPKMIADFPVLYTGINSEWEKMYYSWKHGKRICEYAATSPLPEQTLELLKIPLEERQKCMIGSRSLMDLAFGNGRRDYVDFLNQYPENVTVTREKAERVN